MFLIRNAQKTMRIIFVKLKHFVLKTGSKTYITALFGLFSALDQLDVITKCYLHFRRKT